MPEIDKVIEAQKAIDAIAEELQKLGSAAELISRSKDASDAVLLSSQEIIRRAGEFTTTSGEILQRLGNIDLEQKLQNIYDQIEQTKEIVKKSTNGIVENNKKQFGLVTEEINKNLGMIRDVQKTITDLITLINESNDKSDKQFKKAQDHRDKVKEEMLSGIGTIKTIVIAVSVVIIGILIFIITKVA